MSAPLLDRRTLNRALLQRQLLLERSTAGPLAAVEQLVGLQGQAPAPPFVGLWSRVADFRHEQLIELLEQRAVVRATMMRGTIHHVARADLLRFRATLQPVVDRVLTGGRRPEVAALPDLLPRARALLEAEPRTVTALREPLAAAYPELPADDLTMVVRMRLPLAMLPEPERRYGFPGNAPRLTPIERLVGEPIDPDPRPGELLRRYLAAFGPAAAADATRWSGLGATRALLEAMDDLVRYRDEQGRTLFDLPGRPLPAADEPAPTRFLPRFDNLVLAHADATRVVADEHRQGLVTKNGIVAATFLWDGDVAGTWEIERRGARAVLRLLPFGRLPRAARPALREEGTALLRFAEPDAERYAVEG
ncbi:winged helix DNA-binding domain-containing protein [Patulibacter defluvii]|uniref:winged helix DNA-binding domain-containing protein n=1 Tax=Patulibacter defluvii TaxID=3095358 RepID=UPI002A761DA3|nr:winged helix DNA-binding domain-containing protein [Patulibacter sp. DM4]